MSPGRLSDALRKNSMWDLLFVFVSFACFALGVLYAHACAWLRGEPKNG